VGHHLPTGFADDMVAQCSKRKGREGRRGRHMKIGEEIKSFFNKSR
jgi:hypothetical protein